ncbi:MAG: hypothetical protein ACFFDP_06790, partial [Promethearchaeota archaeon]
LAGATGLGFILFSLGSLVLVAGIDWMQTGRKWDYFLKRRWWHVLILVAIQIVMYYVILLALGRAYFTPTGNEILDDMRFLDINYVAIFFPFAIVNTCYWLLEVGLILTNLSNKV